MPGYSTRCLHICQMPGLPDAVVVGDIVSGLYTNDLAFVVIMSLDRQAACTVWNQL